MKNLRDKVVVITGAASGIGRATAEALSREGARLHLCDLDEAALEETALAIGRAVVHTRKVDVSKREAVKAFADEVHAKNGGQAVDVLINNAGVGLAGGMLNTSLDDWEWVLSVNLWGVIHGCHFFVPKMVEETKLRGGGSGGNDDGHHVVNVASALGLFAAPDIAGYSTSKFAVVGLSESLRAEVQPHNIGVTTICPGLINTNIVKTTRYNQKEPEKARARVVALYKKRNYTPERVADVIVSSIKSDRAVVPVTAEAWVAYYLKRFVPSLASPISRAMARRSLGG